MHWHVCQTTRGRHCKGGLRAGLFHAGSDPWSFLGTFILTHYRCSLQPANDTLPFHGFLSDDIGSQEVPTWDELSPRLELSACQHVNTMHFCAIPDVYLENPISEPERDVQPERDVGCPCLRGNLTTTLGVSPQSLLRDRHFPHERGGVYGTLPTPSGITEKTETFGFVYFILILRRKHPPGSADVDAS
jgi:hypothetical protein